MFALEANCTQGWYAHPSFAASCWKLNRIIVYQLAVQLRTLCFWPMKYWAFKRSIITEVFVFPCHWTRETKTLCMKLCGNRILAGRQEAISVLDVAESHRVKTKATQRDVKTLGWPKNLSNDFSIICYISYDCQLHSCSFWWVIKTRHD